jgi:hypothetical protein
MTMNFKDIIASQELELVKAIRENAKTSQEVMALADLEAQEGVSLEWFSFTSLLSIYKALLTGDLIKGERA